MRSLYAMETGTRGISTARRRGKCRGNHPAQSRILHIVAPTRAAFNGPSIRNMSGRNDEGNARPRD
eukprot:3855429-Pyramimonas_sp.AAC.1